MVVSSPASACGASPVLEMPPECPPPTVSSHDEYTPDVHVPRPRRELETLLETTHLF